jgi:hypothetical protein
MQLAYSREKSEMYRAKPHSVRNKIDLSDPSQVRCLKKRLGISAGDLQHAIGKVGNSIAAVSKELQKVTPATDAAGQTVGPSRPKAGVTTVVA